MTLLAELKVKRIINEVKSVSDVDLIVLRDKNTLSYLFSELYNPPPEEVSALNVIIDVKKGDANVFTSLLDYNRFIETYRETRALKFTPVFSYNFTLPDGVKVLTFDDMRREVENAITNARIVASDTPSICEQRLCINIRPIIEKVRRQKLNQEVELIRTAVNITEKVLKSLLTYIEPGVTEKSIAGKLIELAYSFGADGIAFSPIVAIGKNAALPHYTPKNVVFNGCEPILIDFGVRFGGYVSDITRMILPQKLCKEYEEVEKVSAIINDAIAAALKTIKPGVLASEADKAARDVLKDHGLDAYFIHGLGHGIGIDVHEPPRLSTTSRDALLEGDVVTVEPGVYVYNRYGVRIEEDVYVGKISSEKLTSLPGVIHL